MFGLLVHAAGKARRVLGFVPTPMEAFMRATVGWHMPHLEADPPQGPT